MVPSIVWSLIFSVVILNVIVRLTNIKIDALRQRYTSPDKEDLRPCTVNEMKSFLGLLINSAIFKSNNEDMCTFFATGGTAIILTCLHCDNPNDREMHVASDSAVSIAEMFYKLLKNSQNCYS
ncbi:hypothetical protein PR048_005944 [Dryococelus australis]|uniref:Uncharacterized protein n=1 Tax=Dryococelus australis TaxID=614101 RepID=A0ABQ9I9M1_9NEOP|nr:hypothetical protein PR048_005944 [Dryococelus australis]